MSNKILIHGDPAQRTHEAIAKEALRPGELVQLTGASGGGEGSLSAQESTSSPVGALFAGPTNPTPFGPANQHQAELSQVEGTIEAGDEAVFYTAQPGDIIYGWLDSTDDGGEGTLAAGDQVEPSGNNGALVNTKAGVSNPVAVAVEAVSTPDTDTQVRAKFMVI